ncbi:glycosyltransferase family 10 domain-containing protein, partial [Flavonifractor plautii]
FTIAFENAFMPGYTTEKLVDPFLSHSIPIYWGNPEVTKYYNPKAFINCNDYDNDFDAVIKRVIELDNDKEQYLQMLREPPMNEDFAFDEVDRFEKWLCHIIEKGPHPLSKNPAGFVPVSCPQQFEFIFNEYCSRGEALKIYQNSNIWNIAMGIKKFGDSKWGVVPKKVYHFYLKHKKK